MVGHRRRDQLEAGTENERCWAVRDHVSVLAMSKPHQLISAHSLTRLGRTIRQVLTSEPNEETIRVHGWVKSVRLQKRIAFAKIHDGTTPKGLQVVFRNPADAKLSVPLIRGPSDTDIFSSKG
jgi:hypothetical protein